METPPFIFEPNVLFVFASDTSHCPNEWERRGREKCVDSFKWWGAKDPAVLSKRFLYGRKMCPACEQRYSVYHFIPADSTEWSDTLAKCPERAVYSVNIAKGVADKNTREFTSSAIFDTSESEMTDFSNFPGIYSIGGIYCNPLYGKKARRYAKAVFERLRAEQEREKEGLTYGPKDNPHVGKKKKKG